MKTSAPLEFAGLGLDPSKFQVSDKKSWRGPCPICGGSRRFVIFTDHEWPLWNGFCDQCAHTIKAWLKFPNRITEEQRQRAKESEIKDVAERAEYRKMKLAEFTSHELWQELSERMTIEHIDWWELNGVPRAIQKYLQIGYEQNKAYYNGNPKPENLRYSPAYTIPWFGQDFQFLTMQYRLLNPVNPKNRYRFAEGLGGGSLYYTVDPSESIGDKVVICEGAKKGIVGWFWLSPSGEKYTWLAASSANTFGAALEATKDCGLRYVILDPDADIWARRAAATNPKTTHAVRLPYKLDDGYLQYGLDRSTFEGILRTSL